MHQIVEYVLGIALIITAVQQPEPAIPAMMGLLVVLNTAVAMGPAGAFRLVPRRLHKQLDLVVIGPAVLHGRAAVLDDRLRSMLIGGDRFVLFFIWFHSDFHSDPDPTARRAKRPRRRPGRTDSSETVGKPGALVGGGVNSFKRWKDSLGETPCPETQPPAPWDRPTPPQ